MAEATSLLREACDRDLHAGPAPVSTSLATCAARSARPRPGRPSRATTCARCCWHSRLTRRIIAWSFVPTALILFAVALVAFYAYQQVTEDLVMRAQPGAGPALGQQAGQRAERVLDSTSGPCPAHGHRIGRPDQAAGGALPRRPTAWSSSTGARSCSTPTARVVAAEPERTATSGRTGRTRSYFRQVAPVAGPGLLRHRARRRRGRPVIVVAVADLRRRRASSTGVLAGMFRLGAIRSAPSTAAS